MTSDPAKHAEAVREARNYLFQNGIEYAEAIQRNDGRAADLRQICKARIWKALDAAAAYLDSLPGDGGELADVKFCESVGIRENIRGPEKGFSGLTCVRVCNAEGSVAVTHWKNHLSPYNILYRPTKRQVRAIAVALTPLTPATGGE